MVDRKDFKINAPEIRIQNVTPPAAPASRPPRPYQNFWAAGPGDILLDRQEGGQAHPRDLAEAPHLDARRRAGLADADRGGEVRGRGRRSDAPGRHPQGLARPARRQAGQRPHRGHHLGPQAAPPRGDGQRRRPVEGDQHPRHRPARRRLHGRGPAGGPARRRGAAPRRHAGHGPASGGAAPPSPPARRPGHADPRPGGTGPRPEAGRARRRRPPAAPRRGPPLRPERPQRRGEGLAQPRSRVPSTSSTATATSSSARIRPRPRRRAPRSRATRCA